MLFNSLEFAIFLPIVFIIYWFVVNRNLKLQNLFVVVASYVFYGWWDWRFLSLIFISTAVDFLLGRGFSVLDDVRKRKLLLWFSIIVNIGFLGFFKYYNFFVDNFIEAFALFGKQIQPNTLNIILPVGISFYTFQTLSYTIDVYKRKLDATKDFISFAAFVSFFPQLVAGPIERATNLLPQFKIKRTFDYDKAVDGMRQILWGLFKKIVIADNAAEYVNLVFVNPQVYSGSTLLLGAILFAFQIYGDFSGYSDIAIGTARLFGFNLMRNFAYPYFSRDIAEFWRRWHISLTTWFRDYIYIPLGGSRVSTSKVVRNTFIIFLVSGFWHGANWTFIVWGVYHVILFFPLILLKRNRKYTDSVANGKLLPNIKELSQIVITFLLTVIGWVFFRSESMSDSIQIFSNIFSSSFFSVPYLINRAYYIPLMISIVTLFIIEWIQRDKQHALQLSNIDSHMFKFTIYIVLILVIFALGGKGETFIYFQF